MTGVTNTPTFFYGIKAAAAYINDQLGGVDGHPLQIVYCDDQGQNPSANAACVRGFVADNVIGILNCGTAFGTASLPIAEAAGISAFTPGSDLSEEQSKYTFILDADPTSGFAAVFSYAKKQGKTDVGSMIIDVPQTLTLYRRRPRAGRAEGRG